MPTITTQEIKAEALFDAGEQADGSSDFDGQVLRYINEVYFEILFGGGKFGPTRPIPWPFLIKDGFITIQPPIRTGSVYVTNGSSTITFSSSPSSSSLNGWFFAVHDDPLCSVYRIASHTGGSASATLDAAYLGSTKSSAAYSLVNLDYNLPSDLMQMMEPISFSYPISSNVKYVSYVNVSYHRIIGANYSPSEFTFVGNKRIRFDNVHSTQSIRMDFKYLVEVPQLTGASGEEPVIPRMYRSILSNGATYWILLMKNDDRSAIFGGMVKSKMESMVSHYVREISAIGLGPTPTLMTRKGRSKVYSASGVSF